MKKIINIIFIITPIFCFSQLTDSCLLVKNHTVEFEGLRKPSNIFEYKDRVFDSIRCTYLVVGIDSNSMERMYRFVYGEHSTYKYIIDVCDNSEKYYYSILTFVDDTLLCDSIIEVGHYYDMILYKTQDPYPRMNHKDYTVNIEIDDRHVFIHDKKTKYRIVTSPNVQGRHYCP